MTWTLVTTTMGVVIVGTVGNVDSMSLRLGPVSHWTLPVASSRQPPACRGNCHCLRSIPVLGHSGSGSCPACRSRRQPTLSHSNQFYWLVAQTTTKYFLLQIFSYTDWYMSTTEELLTDIIQTKLNMDTNSSKTEGKSCSSDRSTCKLSNVKLQHTTHYWLAWGG